MDTYNILSLGVLVLLIIAQNAMANGVEKTTGRGIMGAVVDGSSRIGKEQKVAMKMAVRDFNNSNNQSFFLQIQDSHGQPLEAALAAKELTDRQKVQAILGPQRWEEASLVAEVTSQARIPIISLADATPVWATERWPFMVQASSNQDLQMRAIAAIVHSWEWYHVTVIYEDNGSSMVEAIPLLSDSLREVGAEISRLLPVPPSASSMVKELEKIKQDHCRVFLVHLSVPLAIRLFQKANEMGMMKKDYVWITTNAFTSLIHSINTSTFPSMQGIVGVRSYFPDKKPQFQDFDKRFRTLFASEYPEEDIKKPGIYAVQAYDATWALCLAMKESYSKDGQHLLGNILTNDFDGLSGQIHFINKKLAPADKFQVINVVHRRYTELGFWSDRLGFSKSVHEGSAYNSCMKNLGHIFWPGYSESTPRVWAIPTNSKPLQIGVPNMSSFKQYVNVVHNPINNNDSFEGFAIDLFKATVASMPYFLHYKFISFQGTYDNLVEQLHLKKFDAVVGDVALVASRCEHAEFTYPYTESVLVMIVPVQARTSKRELLFMKPFTKAMWALAFAINLYNGFVVWMIERNYSPEHRGSVLNQIGIMIGLSFTTLFSLQGEKLHSNLSRMAMVVWLFVALVITQTYTANLTSILTVPGLEPTVADVQSLQNSNSMVGYCRGSFVARYLTEVLRFRSENLKSYKSPDEYAQGLRSREIAAAFLEAPFAKLFLTKYCNEFIAAGPTYKVGGFGFVFPRGSPLVHDVTKALLNVSEHGKLQELEKAMLASENCVDVKSEDEISSLSPSSFWVLFILTGGTSTVALVSYLIQRRKMIWILILAIMIGKKQLSRRNSDVESPANSVGIIEFSMQP